MKRLTSLLPCLLASLVLASCAPEVGAPPAEKVDMAPPAAGGAPLAPDQAQAAVPTEDLIALVAAGEPADAFDGFAAIPLEVPPGAEPLWAVISTGMHNFDLTPLPSHFIAIYTYVEAGWQQLASLDLDGGDVAPDFLYEDSAQQVDLDPDRIFIEIAGGAGAHGGTYQLVSFYGGALHPEVAMQSPSPGMGGAQDVNGDGALEVVLDQSDPYIFCYACGARKVQFQVLRWDAERADLVEVTLQPLPASEPESVRQPADHGVKLAQAGLWKDAYAEITEARDAAGTDIPEALSWDYALIKLHAEALQSTLNVEWPLIQQVFYGDYPAAVETMRAYDPEDIWTVDSPLTTNPLVMPFVQSLSENLVASASRAVEAEPGLAAAWFIRGWGEYLADPASEQARADVAQAATLAPDDALYTGSVAALD